MSTTIGTPHQQTDPFDALWTIPSYPSSSRMTDLSARRSHRSPQAAPRFPPRHPPRVAGARRAHPPGPRQRRRAASTEPRGRVGATVRLASRRGHHALSSRDERRGRLGEGGSCRVRHQREVSAVATPRDPSRRGFALTRDGLVDTSGGKNKEDWHDLKVMISTTTSDPLGNILDWAEYHRLIWGWTRFTFSWRARRRRRRWWISCGSFPACWCGSLALSSTSGETRAASGANRGWASSSTNRATTSSSSGRVSTWRLPSSRRSDAQSIGTSTSTPTSS